MEFKNLLLLLSLTLVGCHALSFENFLIKDLEFSISIKGEEFVCGSFTVENIDNRLGRTQSFEARGTSFNCIGESGIISRNFTSAGFDRIVFPHQLFADGEPVDSLFNQIPSKIEFQTCDAENSETNFDEFPENLTEELFLEAFCEGFPLSFFESVEEFSKNNIFLDAFGTEQSFFTSSEFDFFVDIERRQDDLELPGGFSILDVDATESALSQVLLNFLREPILEEIIEAQVVLQGFDLNDRKLELSFEEIQAVLFELLFSTDILQTFGIDLDIELLSEFSVTSALDLLETLIQVNLDDLREDLATIIDLEANLLDFEEMVGAIQIETFIDLVDIQPVTDLLSPFLGPGLEFQTFSEIEDAVVSLLAFLAETSDTSISTDFAIEGTEVPEGLLQVLQYLSNLLIFIPDISSALATIVAERDFRALTELDLSIFPSLFELRPVEFAGVNGIELSFETRENAFIDGTLSLGILEDVSSPVDFILELSTTDEEVDSREIFLGIDLEVREESAITFSANLDQLINFDFSSIKSTEDLETKVLDFVACASGSFGLSYNLARGSVGRLFRFSSFDTNSGLQGGIGRITSQFIDFYVEPAANIIYSRFVNSTLSNKVLFLDQSAVCERNAKNGNNTAVIAGSVVGGLVAVLLIFLATSRKATNKTKSDVRKEEPDQEAVGVDTKEKLSI